MSAKSMDKKNRWRSKTVGFRVSPEEWAEIERLVKLSGMTKQEYIMHRLQNAEMIVQASPRVLKAIQEEMRVIEDHYQVKCKSGINGYPERKNLH
ncbi:MAG: hypothetical protein R3Y54_12205 [Eubacteriales bacterium]